MTERIRTIGMSLVLATVVLIGAMWLLQPRPSAAQGGFCSAAFRINVTFENGANWIMCWEEKANEGIIFRQVHYKPPAGTQRLVLTKANLAEVHVPYDEGTPRFFEVSEAGLGGSKFRDLDATDCPEGTLISNGTIDVMCRTVHDRGYAFKYEDVEIHAEEMELFSVSQLGQYAYVVNWTFNDDGSIEPAINFAGGLQKDTVNPEYGWPLGVGNTGYATSHHHNVWWRLDFDLGGRLDDVVEEIEFVEGVDPATRPIAISPHTIEASRLVSPETSRSWRVKDSVITNADLHNISYDLLPESSQVFRGPDYEPWTESDIYITQFNSCERYGTHNPTTGGCGEDMTEYVNGETVADVVVWFGAAFHHLPRDEDEPYMPVHEHGIHIMPRDLTEINPHPTPTPEG